MADTVKLDIGNAINWPHPSVKEAWDSGVFEGGVTECYVQQVVAALLVASGQRSVLELGSYLGYTTLWLADTLKRLGGGTLTTVEIDPERHKITRARVASYDVECICDDSLSAIAALDNRSIGFAWVDDDHQPQHVWSELLALRPKMREGGLICMHDVSGPLGLDAVCRAAGGYVLHFPPLGPAGGLGLIQC